MHTNSTNIRERLIQEVKDCGQDLINRAEEFIGNADVMTDIHIDIQFSITGEELPQINVHSEYYPKVIIDRYREVK